MAEDSWLQREPMRGLIDEVIAAAVRRYRVEEAEASELVREAFAKDRELRRAVESGRSAERVARTRAFKQAAASARRSIYYRLRRYKRKGAETDSAIGPLIGRLERASSPQEIRAVALEIARRHVSTSERLADLDHFHRQLFGLIGKAGTVLDVGSGVHPLVFPFGGLGRGIQRYVAADKDPVAIAAVNAYSKARADGRLVGVVWDIQSGWESLLQVCTPARFDVALLFKLVPVLHRQDRRLLEGLARTPAELWVVTGSKVSMTKRRSIERRERAVLRRFCEMAGRPSRRRRP